MRERVFQLIDFVRVLGCLFRRSFALFVDPKFMPIVTKQSDQVLRSMFYASGYAPVNVRFACCIYLAVKLWGIF